jgi:hypothetical protein
VNDETMREAFEKWAHDNRYPTIRYEMDKDQYDWRMTQALWNAWKASMKVISNESDKAVAEIEYIDDDGVTVKWFTEVHVGAKLYTRARAPAPENEAEAWITPHHLAQLRADDKKNPLGVIGAIVYSRNILHPNFPETRIPLFTRSNAKAGEVDEALVESIAAKIVERRADELFEHGWRTACEWAKRPDMIYDIGSTAYERDKNAALSTHDKTKA